MANAVYAGASAAAAAFVIFVALTQSHVITVPYLTPTILEIQDLQETYEMKDSANFTVTVMGYGSNCHMLQAEIVYLGVPGGERVSFYRKADDCRFMTITHGPYNLTKSFDYGGENVFGREGTYRLDVQFEDPVDGTKSSAMRNFSFGERQNPRASDVG